MMSNAHTAVTFEQGMAELFAQQQGFDYTPARDEVKARADRIERLIASGHTFEVTPD